MPKQFLLDSYGHGLTIKTGSEPIQFEFPNPSPELINLACAIEYRNRLIVNKLLAKGVFRLIDVGSDFGDLVNKAKLSGINSVGIEPYEEARQKAKKAGLRVVDATIQDILGRRSIVETAGDSSSGLIAISMLNILPGLLLKPEAKSELLRIAFVEGDLIIGNFTKREIRRIVKQGEWSSETLGHNRSAPRKSTLQLKQYGRLVFKARLLQHVVDWIVHNIFGNFQFKFQNRIDSYTLSVTIFQKSKV